MSEKIMTIMMVHSRCGYLLNLIKSKLQLFCGDFYQSKITDKQSELVP